MFVVWCWYFFREESEVILHSEDQIAQVGFLKLKKLRLELKLPALDLSGRLSGLPLKDSDFYVSDVSDEEEGKNKCNAFNTCKLYFNFKNNNSFVV